MADKETIGFHKGALNTLVKERQELYRLITVVDQLIQMHMKSLQDMGINLEKEAQKTKASLERRTR